MAVYEQAHMASLFENATEGIIVTNVKGEIVLINPAAQKMFGYSAEDLLSKPIEILIPDKVKPHHHTLRDNFYKAPSNRAMGHGRDLFGQTKTGKLIPVEVSLSHYYQQNEVYVMAFVVDITERKEIEKNMLHQKAELETITDKMRSLNAELEQKVEERTLILKEALQKLEQSQQELSEALDKEKELNEIKGRFVSMASHEFRTPLTTVLSSASLLANYTNTADQEKRNKHIQRIKNSVNNLNEILEDFLSLGKLEEGKVEVKKEAFFLSELIEDTVDEIRSLLKNGQSFQTNCTSANEVVTDKKMVKNILINLIGNAIKFSTEGKVITISADIGIGQLKLKVIDNGIGISKEDQQHLFGSFFRAANSINIQGTGLGLHIVKRYVDLLGGTVLVESELDKGTAIIVSLPIDIRVFN
jgi:PAS domain S-box-containing protein